MTVLYSNDGYKYAWDKLTKNFYIINPDDEVIYMSRNPIKAHAQYEIHTSIAFRKRITKRGYTQTGEKVI